MYRRREKGVLLIITMIVVFIVAGVTGSLLSITTSGSAREMGRDLKFKAREISEAGLDMSLNALRQATDGVDNDGDGSVDEGSDAANMFAPATIAQLEGNLGRIGTLNWTLANDSNGNNLPDFGEQNITPVDLVGGQFFSYSVFSENDGIDNDADGSTDEEDESGSITIIARSQLENYSSTVQFSGIFTETMGPPNPPTWVPDAAFVSGGDVTVTGNCDIYGTLGNIHSNKFMDLGGSSNVTGNATSSEGGNINPGNVAGTVDTAAPIVGVPDINLTNLQALRDEAIAAGADVYFLNDDGTIMKGGAIVSAGGEYHGWKLSGDEWSLSSNKADLDGLFYIDGNVKITGCKQGINMTVLTEGNVAMSGNGQFNSYYNDYFLVSLHDIELSGTPQTTGDLGIIIAREQVKATGNVFVRGMIMACDLDNASAYVDDTLIASDEVTQTSIAGNFDVEYNGGFSTTFPVFTPGSNKYKLDPTFSAYEER